MDEPTSFGVWLRRRRKVRDLTQVELARQVGCTVSLIRKFEAEERRPSRETAARLAEVLGVPAAERASFLDVARATRPVDRLPTALPAPRLVVDHSSPTRSAPRSTQHSVSAQLPTGTVTLLITDVEGSTVLWEQHPAEMPVALARYTAILHDVITANDGVIVKHAEAAIHAAFASAVNAVQAALDAQGALQGADWKPGPALHARMGLHTGTAEVRKGNYYGPTVTRAAQLMAAGHGGQILLSLTTQELVRDDLPPEAALHDLGEHRLKDLARPEHIFQIVSPGLSARFPPLHTLECRWNNLPAQPTSLIGRVGEVAAIVHLLRREDVRLVTLTGAGGTGKTRLALQVAAELLDAFVDGVCFVDLAPIREPALVAATIAGTLGIAEVGGQPLVEGLKAYLQAKQLLLVLDNFEQVVVTAPLVSVLLAAPGLKVLVTSREVLRLSGEHTFAVPPLALPPSVGDRALKARVQGPEANVSPTPLSDRRRLLEYAAVQLFAARAQATKADFSITDANARAVAEICARLDGLPLAIELAAARVRLLPPQNMLGHLQRRLQLLTGGARDLPARQQTLRSTLDWSYGLLDPAEQTLFAQIAVFVGGFTLAAAVAVCTNVSMEQGAARRDFELSPVLDAPGSMLQLLQSLLDKSLLREAVGPDGEPRFVQLETIREYAQECIRASGELEALRDRHAAYYLRLAEQAEPGLLGEQQTAWLARLETEHDNLRAALAWTTTTASGRDRQAGLTGLRLAGALWWFWFVHGHLSEGRRWLDAALASVRGCAFGGEGSRPDTGTAHSDGPDPQPQTLNPCIAKALNGAGVLASHQGDYGAARAHHQESLALRRQLGDQRSIATALNNLGIVAFEQGDYAVARALHQESLALRRELGDQRDIAGSLVNLSNVAFEQGDYGVARALYCESLALYRELGDTWGIAISLNNLGRVAHAQGDYGAARTLHEESLAIRRKLGNKAGIASSLDNLGEVAFEQGDYAVARALHQESLVLHHELGDKRSIASTLEGLAAVAAAQGNAAYALGLAGAASALRTTIGAPRSSLEAAVLDHRLAPARTALSAAAYTVAWEVGRALTLKQAVAFALETDIS